MISKDMYKILKATPRYPNSITLRDLQIATKIAPCIISTVLESGLDDGLVRFASRHHRDDVALSPVSLTENGQLELEEYQRTSNASSKTTWALIISGISAIIAIVGWFFPL